MAPSSLIGVDDGVVMKRLKRLYPDIRLDQALAQDAKFLLEIYSRIGTNLGPLWQEQLIPSVDIDIVQLAAATGDINDSDAQRYSDIALTLQYFSLAFRKSKFRSFCERWIKYSVDDSDSSEIKGVYGYDQASGQTCTER